MGFSLQRALKGAVDAGVSIIDDRLKEEAQQRAREAEMVRQKELAVFSEGLREQREQRAMEMNDAKEVKKRETYAAILKDGRAKMKEDGVKFDSPEAQFRLSEAYSDAGYPEFAKEFFRQGESMRSHKSAEDMKRLQIQAMGLQRSIAAGEREDRRMADRNLKRSEADKAAKKDYDDTMEGFEIKTRNEEGQVTGRDDTLKSWASSVTSELAHKDPAAALQALLKISNVMNRVRAENPGAPLQKIIGLTEEEFKRTPGASTANAGPTESAGPARTTSRPEVDTPSSLSKLGSAVASRVGNGDGDYFGVPQSVRNAFKGFNTPAE